uniref:RdRP small subunit n=1 Tax=Maize-associated tombusvirus TaxID=2201470 RepID=A0A2U9J0Y3_9TOMB|nr:RdRP small subunit [Maize-associated tombusvirus]
MDLAQVESESGWYGFDIDDNGVAQVHSERIQRVRDDVAGPLLSPLEINQLDHKDEPGQVSHEMGMVDIITSMEGMYDGRSTKPLLPPTCVITQWGLQWLKRTLFGDVAVNKVAVEELKKFDLEDNDPLDYVEKHTHTFSHDVVVQGKVVKRESTTKTKKVLMKRNRTNFACAVAKEAYNKFGARPMSDANVLITRKWIQKFLAGDDYQDLRTCDKNIAIDRALFLSFVPTEDFRMMKVCTGSRAWQKRTDPNGLLNGLFGKAFRLSADEPADGMHFA